MQLPFRLQLAAFDDPGLGYGARSHCWCFQCVVGCQNSTLKFRHSEKKTCELCARLQDFSGTFFGKKHLLFSTTPFCEEMEEGNGDCPEKVGASCASFLFYIVIPMSKFLAWCWGMGCNWWSWPWRKGHVSFRTSVDWVGSINWCVISFAGDVG